MTEAEFIKKIQGLKQIKPRKDWVVLTKRELFKRELPSAKERFSIFEIFPLIFRHYRPALATFIFLGIFITAAFSFAQNALPGDFLYTLKKISEKGQAIFVSEADKPQAQLELANKRFEELSRIASANQAQKLAPAINEVQTSVSQAAKNLKKPQKVTKEIVEQAKILAENKEKIESLGVLVGETEELEDALSQLVEREIKDLENRTLLEEQAEILDEAKLDYEEGNLSAALEKILMISNQ